MHFDGAFFKLAFGFSEGVMFGISCFLVYNNNKTARTIAYCTGRKILGINLIIALRSHCVSQSTFSD